MRTGTCRLCRRSADLHDSHLLPAALYKFLKEPTLKNPNPVRLIPGAAVASSHEARQHLLCAECEHRFNMSGEKWMLRNCAQPDGSFPLYNNLTARPAIATINDTTLHASNEAAGIDPEQIVYFAASVFWRAAATEWRNHPGGPTGGRTQIGHYEDPLRMYLLGEASFPEDCALRVIISSPTAAKLLAVFPMEHRIKGMRCHTFVIPGIMMTLVLEKHIPDQVKRLYLSPSPHRVIGVSDTMYSSVMRAIAGQLKASEPKGYLRHFRSGLDARKKR